MTGLEHEIKTLKDYFERQESIFPPGTQKNIAYKKWYLQQLNLIAYKYKHVEGTGAQSALAALAIQRRALEQSLPGRFKTVRRLLSNISKAIVGNKAEKRVIAQHADGHQRILYQLREAGLGKIIDQAEKCMKNGIPKFSLSVSQEVSKDQSFTAYVRFAKNDTGRYDLSYKARLATVGKDGVKIRSLNNEENGLFNNERAISLLLGRAVKDHYFIQGQQHTEWLLLDFSDVNGQGAARIKHYDAAFGYDLSSAFDNLTGKENQFEEKESIIRKLENGNQVSLLLAKDKGAEEGVAIRIAADPVGKGFMFYDQLGKQISQDKALGKEKTQSGNTRIAVPRPNRILKIH